MDTRLSKLSDEELLKQIIDNKDILFESVSEEVAEKARKSIDDAIEAARKWYAEHGDKKEQL